MLIPQERNELVEAICQVIDTNGPIKATELVTRLTIQIYGHDHRDSIQQKSQEVDKLVDCVAYVETNKLRPFINYSLPDTPYREKTMFFPAGTAGLKITLDGL